MGIVYFVDDRPIPDARNPVAPELPTRVVSVMLRVLSQLYGSSPDSFGEDGIAACRLCRVPVEEARRANPVGGQENELRYASLLRLCLSNQGRDLSGLR